MAPHTKHCTGRADGTDIPAPGACCSSCQRNLPQGVSRPGCQSVRWRSTRRWSDRQFNLVIRLVADYLAVLHRQLRCREAGVPATGKGRVTGRGCRWARFLPAAARRRWQGEVPLLITYWQTRDYEPRMGKGVRDTQQDSHHREPDAERIPKCEAGVRPVPRMGTMRAMKHK